MADTTDSGDRVYEVIGQIPVSRYDEGGNPSDGVEVRFRIPSISVVGSVWVPGESPDPDEAQRRIREWVSNAFAIAALGN